MNVFKRFIRRHKLKTERTELIIKREYLIKNGFPLIFNGKNYIQDRINEINKELNT